MRVESFPFFIKRDYPFIELLQGIKNINAVSISHQIES